MKYSELYWNDIESAITCIPQVEALYGKNILITGGTGMICSAVADVLLWLNRHRNAGIQLYLAGRSEAKTKARFEGFTEADGLHFAAYDATTSEPPAVSEKLDYIIHGASNASPDLYMKQPVETMLSNILGLNTMLDFAVKNGTGRLLYVSSSEVYGRKTTMDPFDEGDYGYVDILGERSGYPSAKRAGETLCVAYGMEHGTDTVIVRPGHIYGPTIQPSDKRASAEFTRKAVAGEDIVMKSKGEQLRSYCHTLDCATALLTVLLKGERSTAYNISNPISICTIREIAEAIARAGGVKIVFDLPSEAEAKSYNPMNNSSLRSDRLEALGWKPYFNLESGVESMIKVLKA